MDVLLLNGASAALWERFQEGREAPTVDATGTRVIERWSRVQRLGAPALGLPEIPVVPASVLRHRQDEHGAMLRAAREVIEDASRAMSDAHYTLLLCDPSGLVIGRWGGGEFADVADRARLIEGADWSEGSRGTNAIGTALVEGRAVAVEGCAHYARDNHGLACYASVLRGPGGELLGLVDATSFSRAASPLVSVAVAGLARAIEERLRVLELARGRARAPAARRPSVPADPFDVLVGHDPALLEAKARASRFARSSLPVLLLAETGTGKELMARAIHQASPRADGPFVAVNCGALSSQLLESELFGYGPGAFTGARPGGQAGKLEAASGGTLFLDEIAEMPAHVQAMLLRVLEDGTYSRVGEVEPRRADLRLIGATCRDLEAMVRDGRFRSDLYFRIRGATLGLPPLARRTDVLALADALLAQLARADGRAPPVLSAAARQAIAAHPWPGNVRELKSALLHALVLADDEIGPEHLPEPSSAVSARVGAATGTASRGGAGPEAPEATTRGDAERAVLAAALERARGNLTQAAAQLGVARSTLYRMMDRHGFRR